MASGFTANEILFAHMPPEGYRFVEARDGSLALPASEDTTNSDLQEALLNAWRPKYWFLDPKYAGTTPHQHWLVQAAGLEFDVRNYAEGVIRQGHLYQMAAATALFQAHYPIPPERAPRDIVITQNLPPSEYGGAGYPGRFAVSTPVQRVIEISYDVVFRKARRFRPELHRVKPLTGVMIHELVHCDLDTKLEDEWDRTPESYVTDYGRQMPWWDDIADTVVADLLRYSSLVPAEKRQLLRGTDRHGSPVPRHVTTLIPSAPRLPSEIAYSLISDQSATLKGV